MSPPPPPPSVVTDDLLRRSNHSRVKQTTNGAIPSTTLHTNQQDCEEDLSGKTFLGRWRLERTIGKGSYGRVYLGRCILGSTTSISNNQSSSSSSSASSSCMSGSFLNNNGNNSNVANSQAASCPGELAALKFIPKTNLRKATHWARLQREIALLKAMQHPHIIRLYEHLETQDHIILVMEYADGGDLYDLISHSGVIPANNQNNASSSPHHQAMLPPRLEEALARHLFRQIVSALDYCHHYNIVHRDIKPENVMLCTESNGKATNSPVLLSARLIDFGFANIYDPQACLRTNCGSPLYACPQIIQNEPYTGPEVDVWSLGVTLYAMLTGQLPFEDPSLKGLYAKICAGKFGIPGHVSGEARSLLCKMLVVEPAQRITLSQIKMHAWYGSPEVTLYRDVYLYGRDSLDDTVLDDLLATYYGSASQEDRVRTIESILREAGSAPRGLYQLLLSKKHSLTLNSQGTVANHNHQIIINAGTNVGGNSGLTGSELRRVEEGLMSPPLTPLKQLLASSKGTSKKDPNATKTSISSGLSRMAQNLKRWVAHQ